MTSIVLPSPLRFFIRPVLIALLTIGVFLYTVGMWISLTTSNTLLQILGQFVGTNAGLGVSAVIDVSVPITQFKTYWIFLITTPILLYFFSLYPKFYSKKKIRAVIEGESAVITKQGPPKSNTWTKLARAVMFFSSEVLFTWIMSAVVTIGDFWKSYESVLITEFSVYMLLGLLGTGTLILAYGILRAGKKLAGVIPSIEFRQK